MKTIKINKNKNYYYAVMQGNFYANGSGDYWEYATTSNKQEAYEYFNSIKNDYKDYKRIISGYIETIIEKRYLDYDEVEIIESFKHYHK